MTRNRQPETKVGKFEALGLIPRGHKSVKYACRCLVCDSVVHLSSYQFYRSNAKCPTCLGFKRSANLEEKALRGIFSSYKQNAKKRGYPFQLTFKEFLTLVEASCHYCAAAPTNIANKIARYNGIDRKINELGYVDGNCVTCCKFCNFAKRNFGYEEFLAWINNIKEAAMRR